MTMKRIRLNDKIVWQTEPYTPNYKMMPAFVGRDSELELVMASLLAASNTYPLSPVLVGDPGVGKNRIIYELARITGRDLYVFQGHEDITAEDLAVTVRFSDDKANMMEYVLSPLVCAMLNGGIFFLDEIGKIRPRALALLVSVLDERRYIDSTLLGDRVSAQPGFRFIAATNTGEMGMLPDFIRSRMRPVIKVGYPPRQEIEEIIKMHFRSRMENLTSLLERFWYMWDKRGADILPPTPRDAIAVFSMANNISELGFFKGKMFSKATANADVCTLESPNCPIEVSNAHVDKAISELFS